MSDADAVSALLRPLLLAEEIFPADQLRYRIGSFPRGGRPLWLVAESSAKVVGFASSEPQVFDTIPGLRRLWVGVAEPLRGTGIGAKLYRAVEDHAESLDCATFRSWTTADMPDGVRFLERRGYRRAATERQWAVDPRSVDTSELAQRIASAARDGYRLASLGELLAAGKHRALHRLFMRADADGPHLSAASPVSFTTWRRFVVDTPILDREASAVALHGEEPVALCWLNVDRASARAVHEFTGTLPAHRHRGLAHLTKLAALDWAARSGITHVGTANDSGNRDILVINKHLGYRRLADAYLYLRKPPP